MVLTLFDGDLPDGLNLLREYCGLAPPDNLKRWKLIVADNLKMSIGSLSEIFWRVRFKSEQ